MADQFGNYTPNPGNPFLGYPLTVPSSSSGGATGTFSATTDPPVGWTPSGVTFAFWKNTTSGRIWTWDPVNGAV
jgi:hypothetical protein